MDDLWEALIEISKTQVVIANAVLRLSVSLLDQIARSRSRRPGTRRDRWNDHRII